MHVIGFIIRTKFQANKARVGRIDTCGRTDKHVVVIGVFRDLTNEHIEKLYP